MNLNGRKLKKDSKVTMQESRVKTMLTEFFYAKDIISYEFVPKKQTADGKFYKDVIERLKAGVHGVRSEFQESGPWFLWHYNAPAQSSGVFSEFSVKRMIPLSFHPLYSPNLALADFFIS